MSRKKDRKGTEKKIIDFFNKIEGKSPSEIMKIKKLAMHNNIKLGVLKRKFCSKCFFPLDNSRKRINKGKISITCQKCGNIKRYSYKS